MYTNIILTEREMRKLDDGQDWWAAGDTVNLGGYLPDENPNPAFSITINGYGEHDNFMSWADMPTWLQKRLRLESPTAKAAATLGSIRSERKAASSRANGRLGG